MPYVPRTSANINTNPKTPAQVRATLARLARTGLENIEGIEELEEVVDLLKQFTERPATADVDTTHGQAVRVSSEGHMALADASALSTAGVAGVALSDAVTGSVGFYAATGIVEKADWGLTPGGVYFLSTTAGGLTLTPAISTGNVIIIVGRALSTTELFVSPAQAILM